MAELEHHASGSSAKTAGGLGVYEFGAALAIAISWTTQKSVLWAILYGILSWAYVLYYAYLHR
ncbi:MAG: hypothetical protein HY078_12695 [Elusimicrobia bacterium]|nr:hypothetical protein [Elusimicrobiota bacterium]